MPGVGEFGVDDVERRINRCRANLEQLSEMLKMERSDDLCPMVDVLVSEAREEKNHMQEGGEACMAADRFDLLEQIAAVAEQFEDLQRRAEAWKRGVGGGSGGHGHHHGHHSHHGHRSHGGHGGGGGAMDDDERFARELAAQYEEEERVARDQPSPAASERSHHRAPGQTDMFARDLPPAFPAASAPMPVPVAAAPPPAPAAATWGAGAFPGDGVGIGAGGSEPSDFSGSQVASGRDRKKERRHRRSEGAQPGSSQRGTWPGSADGGDAFGTVSGGSVDGGFGGWTGVAEASGAAGGGGGFPTDFAGFPPPDGGGYGAVEETMGADKFGAPEPAFGASAEAPVASGFGTDAAASGGAPWDAMPAPGGWGAAAPIVGEAPAAVAAADAWGLGSHNSSARSATSPPQQATMRIRAPFDEIASDMDGFKTNIVQGLARAAGIPPHRIRIQSVRPG